MPKSSVKGGLGSKLKKAAPKALKNVRGNETKVPGGGTLPSGIDHGIAQLVDCKFDTYKKGDNKGEYYLLVAGVCVQPKEVKTKEGVINCEGLRIQKMIPIHDRTNQKGETYATIEEQLDKALNALRLLGADTADVDEDALEALAESLKEAAPYFQFRTFTPKATKDYPDPKVQEVFGKVVDFDPEDDGSEVEEEEEEEAEVEEVETEEEETEEAEAAGEGDYSDMSASELADVADEDADAQAELASRAQALGLNEEDYDDWPSVAIAIDQAKAKKSSKKKTTSKEPAAGKPTKKVPTKKAVKKEPTLEELGTIADEGDQDAAGKLEEMCEELELDSNDYPTWSECAEAIVEAQAGNAEEIVKEAEEEEEEAEGEEEQEEMAVPEKGDVYYFKPPKAKKFVECEVTAVFTKAEKVNLKNMDDQSKTYKSVPFTSLQMEA